MGYICKHCQCEFFPRAKYKKTEPKYCSRDCYYSSPTRTLRKNVSDEELIRKCWEEGKSKKDICKELNLGSRFIDTLMKRSKFSWRSQKESMRTIATIKKLREAQLGRKCPWLYGENNPVHRPDVKEKISKGNFKTGISIYRKSVNLSKCTICHSENKIQVHHKDHNRHNNNLENLMVLCASCHAKQHSEKWICNKIKLKKQKEVHPNGTSI